VKNGGFLHGEELICGFDHDSNTLGDCQPELRANLSDIHPTVVLGSDDRIHEGDSRRLPPRNASTGALQRAEIELG
jgi:hypothetical protein